MSRQTLEVALLGFVGLGLTLYVVFGGADFGGGVWDLFASGPTRGDQRALIEAAVGPVWEANHVWLIFVIVVVLSAFPPAIAIVGVALYLPLSLAMLGIVFRGAAFAFFTHTEPGVGRRAWGHVFGIASLITPFFLGAAGASIAAGTIRVQGEDVRSGALSSWISPLSMVSGLLLVCMCAYLAAVFLTMEAVDRDRSDLEMVFRLRALGASFVSGVLALVGLIALRAGSPTVWSGMLSRGWSMVVLSGIAGEMWLVALLCRRYKAAGGAAARAVGVRRGAGNRLSACCGTQVHADALHLCPGADIVRPWMADAAHAVLRASR